MASIHLVHGFNVSDGGEKTVARLQPYLEDYGHNVKLFSYGWVGLMGVWFLNPRIVKEFMERIEPGDCAIGHSNGCVIIHMAAFYGAPLRLLIYFSPALKTDLPIAEQVEHVQVNSTPFDSAVKFARWVRLLVPWAPFGDPIWGDMGVIGYGPDGPRDHEYSRYFYEDFVHFLEVAANKYRLFRLMLRLFVGVPFFLVYWLIFGPIEILLGFVKNNIFNPKRATAINVRHREDRSYLLYAAVIPGIFWTSILYAVV